MSRGDRWPTPRELARRRCRARIDGRHEWVYVGGTTARCPGCGAEAIYDPATRRLHV